MDKKVCKQVRLWGIVKDKKGNSMANRQVKLMKKIKKGSRASYQVIAEGITSRQGMYSFDIQVNRLSEYKIIVIDE